MPDLPPTPTALDRRTHQRVEVDLTGRFMAEDAPEQGCRAIDMSPGGVALKAEHIPPVGARVVAYLDHLGRVEGEVVRRIEGGFAMTVKATPRRRDKLAAQLTYLANRSDLSLPEDRRHTRVSLSRTRTVLTLVNGTEIPVDVIDASISGAAVATDQRPEPGTPAFVGAVRGRIVRHIEAGLAVEFAQVQDEDLLEWALIEGRATV
ncbi:MAG: PilZ domain-containing protein [Pseudomonadota bacterium]